MRETFCRRPDERTWPLDGTRVELCSQSLGERIPSEVRSFTFSLRLHFDEAFFAKRIYRARPAGFLAFTRARQMAMNVKQNGENGGIALVVVVVVTRRRHRLASFPLDFICSSKQHLSYAPCLNVYHHVTLPQART